MNVIIETTGWCGTIAILLAYGLLTKGYLRPEHRSYNILNLVGAFGLGVSGIVTTNYQSIAVQIVFGSIAIWAIRKGQTVPTAPPPEPAEPSERSPG